MMLCFRRRRSTLVSFAVSLTVSSILLWKFVHFGHESQDNITVPRNQRMTHNSASLNFKTSSGNHPPARSPYHWINSCNCSMVDKLNAFGQVLSAKRSRVNPKASMITSPEDYQGYSAVFEWEETFFDQVSSMPSADILFLPWARNFDSWRTMNKEKQKLTMNNLLPIKNYHPSFVTKSMVRRFSFRDQHEGAAVLPVSVPLPLTATKEKVTKEINTFFFDHHGMSPHRPRCPGSLDYMAAWNISQECSTYHCSGFPDMMTYVIVLKGQKYRIALGMKGRIWIPDTKQMLVMNSCYKDVAITEFNSTFFADEVFYISQAMVGNIYHGFAESLTRLALFVPFLRQNPDIQIQFTPDSYTKLLLPFVIDMYNLKNTVIMSKSQPVQANTVYVPPGMHCFRGGGLLSLQMTSQHFHAWIEKRFPENNTRNVIIILKRTTRHLRNYDEIYEIVKSHVDKMSGDVILYQFDDQHLPGVEETMHLFYRALVVIGVHGAGLTNLMFTRPDTHLVEFHCGYMIPTFKEMAYKLGLYHYPVVTEKLKNGDCHTMGPQVDAEEVKGVMSVVFKALKTRNRS